MSTSYSSINSLDEFAIIGGTDFTLRFSITDEDGLPVDLTGSTLLLKIAPYGQPSNVITTLTGSIGTTDDIAEYVLPATTSEGMVGGKYMYQPIIEDALSKIHRPKQGVFLLVQAIGNFADVIDVPSSAYYIYGTGTNAYSSTNTSITSYYAGLSIILYVQNTNTVNATLEMAGVVGTKALAKFNSVGAVVSLIAGDLLANKKYLFVYDGTDWVMVGRCNSEIDHGGLMNIGTNTHAQIDTFIGTTVPTTYAPLASPALTGNPTAPTPTVGDDDTSIATTAFVNAEITNDRPYSDTNPVMNGTAAQGDSARVSRQNHVHPTDTSRAPLASPTFTGTPSAPTAALITDSTQIATTAFVKDVVNVLKGFDAVFMHGASLAVPASSTRNLSPLTNHLGVTTEGRRPSVTRTGTLKSLVISTGSTQPATGNLVIVLQIEGVDTDLKITIPANTAAGNFSNAVNIAPIVIGERFLLKLKNAATSDSASINSCSMEFEYSIVVEDS